MKCKTCGTDHRGVAKHGGYCLDHQEQRAEAAEAERDEARRQLAEAVAAERERCIEIALDCFFDLTDTSTMSAPEVIKRTRHGIAAAIRARSHDPH